MPDGLPSAPLHPAPLTPLSSTGATVSRIGLGCMAMSGSYGPADEAESIATIHAALDAGITLLDTGDFYGAGHNELLIREALRGRAREQVVLSVKFGRCAIRPAPWSATTRARPLSRTSWPTACAASAPNTWTSTARARVDPNVPIEETVGAIAEMVQAGYVRQIGLSEAGAETIRRASAVHPICDVQLEYSLISRGIEGEILPTCRELGIGVTAYGVLSQGLLGGQLSRGQLWAPGDFRAFSPRFSGENLDHNLALVEALRAIAQAKGASLAQIVISWVLSRGADIVPLIGTRRRDRLADSLGALDVALSPADLAAIERAVPPGGVRGERYPGRLMAELDGERRSAATGR